MVDDDVAGIICPAPQRGGPGAAARRQCQGRAVQLDSIKTRVESAYRFSA